MASARPAWQDAVVGMAARADDGPVLLLVHGGPGMQEYWLTKRYPTRMHEAFTLAWWEQRGAGLSYRSDVPAESMTVAQLIDDTLVVARHLRERFGVEKVHLMAHSWGSFIGLQAAARAPELFASYIGMAQVTHQIASEQEAGVAGGSPGGFGLWDQMLATDLPDLAG